MQGCNCWLVSLSVNWLIPRSFPDNKLASAPTENAVGLSKVHLFINLKMNRTGINHACLIFSSSTFDAGKECVCVCVRVTEIDLGEHLIYLPDCCVTMITSNGCHYSKWPDYSNSVWKTYWRLNKPALNETLLRLTLWHVYKRLSHTALTVRAAEAIITFVFSC